MKRYLCAGKPAIQRPTKSRDTLSSNSLFAVFCLFEFSSFSVSDGLVLTEEGKGICLFRMAGPLSPFPARRNCSWRGSRPFLDVFLLASLLVVSDESLLDCYRNSTVAAGTKGSYFDYKTAVVENGKSV